MNSIKKQIGKIDFLYNFYHFHISGRLKKDPTELIRRAFRWQSKVFFIQIGSNDGKTGDPLYPLIKKEFKYRGLFVEPVPYLFRRLQNNYSFRKDLLFENAAINAGREQTFYWIDPSIKEQHPNLPPWFDQLGSFKENHIYGAPGIADILLKYRRESPVRGLTFQELLLKNNVSEFDILHIDTEGYDYQVLSQVDFDKYQPKVVLYEHKCLTPEEKESAIKILEKKYHLNDIGSDMFCTRKV